MRHARIKACKDPTPRNCDGTLRHNNGPAKLTDKSQHVGLDLAVRSTYEFNRFAGNLAPPAGFEPTAPGLGILCSIHLS
jgi:hypothetical protein